MIPPMRTWTQSAILVLVTLLAAAPAPQDGKLAVGSDAPGSLNSQVEFLVGGDAAGIKKDSVGVVHFWSPDGGDAAGAFGKLSELQRSYGPRGLAVIGVCLAPVEEARELVQSRQSLIDYVVACPKKDDDAAKRAWVDGAGKEASSVTFVMGRTGKILYIGSVSDAGFDRVVRLAIANRYDPDAERRAQPALKAARDSAKRRNYKEAVGHYEKALADGAYRVETGMECWRMLAEQANDAAGAKKFLLAQVEGMSSDRTDLAEAVRYMASEPSIRKRDLETAQVAADKLKALPGADDDPDALSAMAALAAAKGDMAAAVDLQYSAWMSAGPADKPALQRTLETYEKKAGAAGPK